MLPKSPRYNVLLVQWREQVCGSRTCWMWYPMLALMRQLSQLCLCTEDKCFQTTMYFQIILWFQLTHPYCSKLWLEIYVALHMMYVRSFRATDPARRNQICHRILLFYCIIPRAYVNEFLSMIKYDETEILLNFFIYFICILPQRRPPAFSYY